MTRKAKGSGGTQLFQEFLRRPGLLRRMHAISRGILWGETNSDDWDDVIQIAIIRAFEGIGTFRGASESEFMAWFTKIVRNTAIDAARSRGRSAVALSEEAARTLVSDEPSTEEMILDREGQARRLERLERGLDRLSPLEQAVVNLSLRYGFVPEKVEELLGVSRSSYKAALARAVRRLRRVMSTGS